MKKMWIAAVVLVLAVIGVAWAQTFTDVNATKYHGKTGLKDLTETIDANFALVENGSDIVMGSGVFTNDLTVTNNISAVTISNEATECYVSNIQVEVGTPSVPSITFTDDQDTGLWRPSANRVGLSCAGATNWVAQTSTIDFYAQLECNERLRLVPATATIVSTPWTQTVASAMVLLVPSQVSTVVLANASSAGEVVTFVNRIATNVVFTDGGTLKLSGNITLGQFDSLTLISSAADEWVELSTSDN